MIQYDSKGMVMKKVSMFLIVVTLLAGMVGCEGEGEGEIVTTYDLTIASVEGGNVTTPGEGTFVYCHRIQITC